MASGMVMRPVEEMVMVVIVASRWDATLRFLASHEEPCVEGDRPPGVSPRP